MKHLLVPYIFKLDEDIVIGDNKRSPEFKTHVDKKFINQIIGQCVGTEIYVRKENAEILLGENDGDFWHYPNDWVSVRSIATVASYSYTGLWLEVPELMIPRLKDFNIKIAFRWNCISDEKGIHIDSISDVWLAYKPEKDNYPDSVIKPGCEYIII